MEDLLVQLYQAKNDFYDHLNSADYAKNYAESLHDCLRDELIEPEEAREEYEVIQGLFPRLYRIKNYIGETLAPYQIERIEVVEETTATLEDYYHRNPEVEQAAEDYALALWLLYSHPESKNHEAILATLSELLNAFPDNETICDKYYQVLDTQEDHSPSRKDTTPKKVKVVISKKLSTEDDACKYAKTLCDIAIQQTDEEEIVKTCKKLLSFSEKHPANHQVHLYCANAFYNVLDNLNQESNRSTLLVWFKALSDFATFERVDELYANVLEDLPTINIGILDDLKELLEKYPENNSILDSYGYALSKVIFEQGYSKEYKQLAHERFVTLQNNYPENENLSDLLL